jgi:hypothetical protein
MLMIKADSIVLRPYNGYHAHTHKAVNVTHVRTKQRHGLFPRCMKSDIPSARQFSAVVLNWCRCVP